MTNFLGIDYGQKRIGLALGNNQARLAEPLTVVANDDDLMAGLKEIVVKHQIDQLVLGLPRGLDGQETAQTRVVRQFASDHLSRLGLPVKWQDEAVTSEAAQKNSRPGVDARAAALILQDFLDQ